MKPICTQTKLCWVGFNIPLDTLQVILVTILPPNLWTGVKNKTEHNYNQVSEWPQLINGRSAQSGYTVPFTSVHAGKYKTEDKLKTDSTKTKHNPGKANNAKYSKTKLAWFRRLIRHSARKRGGGGVKVPHMRQIITTENKTTAIQCS